MMDKQHQQSIDTDHVVLLQKIDKLILASEAANVEPGICRRIYSIRNLLVVHAGKAQDFKEDLTKLLNKNRIRILVLGGISSIAILVPYLMLTRTSAFLHKPILCNEFKTKSTLYPGSLEVCINGITRSYSRLNGDVELDITFMSNVNERTQADVVFWIADRIADKEVDYSGEYNIDRIRIYENGLLVNDDHTKISGWTKPLVPDDVRMPLWQWVRNQRPRLMRDKMPLDESLEKFTSRLGAIIASIGSVGLTVYRFLRLR